MTGVPQTFDCDLQNHSLSGILTPLSDPQWLQTDAGAQGWCIGNVIGGRDYVDDIKADATAPTPTT